jgi:hypothetical protein
MSLKAGFSGCMPYLVWLVASSAILIGAWATDPYVFGFSAFGSAAISLALLAVSPFFGIRPMLWAILATVPTVLLFALLSTYKWA